MGKITFSELLEKIKQQEQKVMNCEQDGGHSYAVDGFSVIEHPEVSFGILPMEKDISKVQFRSCVCKECGNRVSMEDGRAYERNMMVVILYFLLLKQAVKVSIRW